MAPLNTEGETMKRHTIETGTNLNGTKYRLIAEAGKFSVIWQDAYSWKYAAKKVSEQAARDAFFLATVKP